MTTDQATSPSLPATTSIWAIRPDYLAIVAAGHRVLQANDALRIRLEEQLQEQEAAFGRRGGPRTQGGVAVLGLKGMITPQGSLLSMLFGFGGGGLQQFRANFRDALADADVSAIVLDIDSPGGLADLVAETAAEIRAARGQKPIVAVANTLAASAAYWIASQADELVVTPSGEVGSIGVFTRHEDWSKFDADLGVDTTIIKAGRYKVEANPYEPLSEEARAAIQESVDDFYDLFVADVAAGRGASAREVRSGFGEGRVVTAKRALPLKMADRVESLEQTINGIVGGRRRRRATAAGDSDPTLLALDEARDRLDLPPASASADDDPSQPDGGDEPEERDGDPADEHDQPAAPDPAEQPESSDSDAAADKPNAEPPAATDENLRRAADVLFG